MANNKVIQVLNSLNKKEYKLLDKFILSPFVNQHKDVQALYDYFSTVIKSGKGSLKNEIVYEKIWPNQSFQVQKLHHINSYLLKVLELFLSWLEWQDEETKTDLHLIRAYRKHHLDDIFKQSSRKTLKKLEKQPLRNNEFYHTAYQLQVENLKFGWDRRSEKLDLQELTNMQDVAFIAEKLYNACTLISHQTVAKKEYDTGLLQNVLNFLKDNPGYLDIPAIAAYYYSFLALTQFENEDNFKNLKSVLVELKEKFTTSELRGLYLVAVNFCIRKINRGETPYIRQVFELYQSGLQVNAYLENNVLSRWTYKNIVVIGLKLKEFDWVFSFIHDYVELLPPNHQEGSKNLNLAHYFFTKGEYDNCMGLLLRTEHDDVLHNLFAKSMLAKIYYEQGEFDALDNLLDSLKTYLRRKKDLGYHRTNYMNFTRFLQKLTGVNSYDKSALRELANKVKDEKSLVEREWLIEKIGSQI